MWMFVFIHSIISVRVLGVNAEDPESRSVQETRVFPYVWIWSLPVLLLSHQCSQVVSPKLGLLGFDCFQDDPYSNNAPQLRRDVQMKAPTLLGPSVLAFQPLPQMALALIKSRNVIEEDGWYGERKLLHFCLDTEMTTLKHPSMGSHVNKSSGMIQILLLPYAQWLF